MEEDSNQGAKNEGIERPLDNKNHAADGPTIADMVEDNLDQLENLDDLMEYEGTQVPTDDELENIFVEEVPWKETAQPTVEDQRALAAIPDTATPSCASKRRAGSVAKNSLDRAERIKAARNLDFILEKGNCDTSQISFISFSNEHMVDNLEVLGISLGNNVDSVNASVAWVKEVELERLECTTSGDKISDIFDKEEKEMMENEEVDKLILNSLC
jgi:hypothetical protein